jgi:hypothetical protein
LLVAIGQTDDLVQIRSLAKVIGWAIGELGRYGDPDVIAGATFGA